MALIQYNLEVGQDGHYQVTPTVLRVNKGDKIQFRSNVPNAAIKFKKASPFVGTGTPQAGEAFDVGNKRPTKPFTVAKISKTAIKFDCGVRSSAKPPLDRTKYTAPKPGNPDGFVSWGVGSDVPPGGSGK
jgi:hypothetical protein